MTRRMSDGSVRTIGGRGSSRRASVGSQEIPSLNHLSSRTQNQVKLLNKSQTSETTPIPFSANTTKPMKIDSTTRGTSTTLAHRRQKSMPIQMLPSRSNSSFKDFQLQSQKTPPISETSNLPAVQMMSKGSPIADNEMSKPFWSLKNDGPYSRSHKRSTSKSSIISRKEETNGEGSQLQKSVLERKEEAEGLGSSTSSSTPSINIPRNLPKEDQEAEAPKTDPFRGSPSKWSPALLNPSPTLKRASTEETLRSFSRQEGSTPTITMGTSFPPKRGILKTSHSSSSLGTLSSSSSPSSPTLSDFKIDALSTPFSLKALRKKCSFDSGLSQMSLAEPISREQLMRMRPTSAGRNVESSSLPACPNNSPTDVDFSQQASQTDAKVDFEANVGVEVDLKGFLSQASEGNLPITRRASAGDILEILQDGEHSGSSVGTFSKPIRKGIFRNSASLTSLNTMNIPPSPTFSDYSSSSSPTSPTSISEFKIDSLSTPFSMNKLKKKCSFKSEVLQNSLSDPISKEELFNLRPVSAERNRESQSVPPCPNNSPTDSEFSSSNPKNDQVVKQSEQKDEMKQVDNLHTSSPSEENQLKSPAFTKPKGFGESRSNLKPPQLQVISTPRKSSSFVNNRPTTPPISPTPRSPVSKSPNLSSSFFSTPESEVNSSRFSPSSDSSDDSSITFPKSPRWRVNTFSPQSNKTSSSIKGNDDGFPCSYSPPESPSRLSRSIKEEKEEDEELDRMQLLKTSDQTASSSDSVQSSSTLVSRFRSRTSNSPPATRKLSLGFLESVGEEQE